MFSFHESRRSISRPKYLLRYYSQPMVVPRRLSLTWPRFQSLRYGYLYKRSILVQDYFPVFEICHYEFNVLRLFDFVRGILQYNLSCYVFIEMIFLNY